MFHPERSSPSSCEAVPLPCGVSSVWCLMFGVLGVLGVGFEEFGVRFRVQSIGVRVNRFGFGVESLEVQDQGFARGSRAC